MKHTHTFKFMLATSIAVAVSACSSTPVTPKNVLRETILNSDVVVAPVSKPAQLAERTKAKAVGNFVVATVASSAIGSSAGAANAQEMQANMQIMQSFNQNLQQALPDSYVLSAGKGADLALAKKISDYLANRPSSLTPGKREISIAVHAPLWELGYVSFLTSQDYALNYNLRMVLLEQIEGKQKVLKTVSCGSSANEKMPLEKWQAENYKAVDTSAEIIVSKCFDQFLAETGLN